MQGYSILKTVFDSLIDTGLTSRVFHSVKKITNDKGESYPLYPTGAEEFTYVGIDDTKVMTVYCRQTGDLRPLERNLIGSAEPYYKVAVLHRIVAFNDYEKRRQDDLLAKFMQFTFLPGVRLIAVITDKEKLASLESTAKGFHFGDETFYIGIDFEIILNLKKANCEIEIGCSNICNPYTKQ